MPKKFYNCSYDLVFKAVFSDPKSIPILKELIKEVTGIDAKEISYLSGNVPLDSIYSKERYVDLVVKTDNEIVNIEINNNHFLDEDSTKIRNLSYIMAYYTNNILNNMAYNKIKKHIQINYTFTESNDDLLDKYELQNSKDKLLVKNFEVYIISMNKLLKKYRKNDILELDNFKYSLLLGLNKEELDKYTKGDKNMEEFKDKVNKLNNDNEFIQFITREQDEQMIINTVTSTAEEKGIQQGLEQGTINTKTEAAINLYNNGISKDIIAKSLNLTIEELNKILKNTTN